ncbi:hypothetical protein B0H10DRAFT_980191 [Mycena sp. CBHHK59/15]|nr:hypothetical protein B0H10DRAFT_980191 [Mycena sp. CBHHK59/15]
MIPGYVVAGQQKVSQSALSMNTGYYKLNTSALQIFTRALEANPTGDSEETLQRIYTSYPRLRSQVDKRRAYGFPRRYAPKRRLRHEPNRPEISPSSLAHRGAAPSSLRIPTSTFSS